MKLILILLFTTNIALAGLNLDTAKPVSTNSITSYTITGYSIDLTNRYITVRYDELDGAEVIKSSSVALTGSDYTGVMGSLPAAAKALKINIVRKIYGVMKTKLGVTGTIN